MNKGAGADAAPHGNNRATLAWLPGDSPATCLGPFRQLPLVRYPNAGRLQNPAGESSGRQRFSLPICFAELI